MEVSSCSACWLAWSGPTSRCCPRSTTRCDQAHLEQEHSQRGGCDHMSSDSPTLAAGPPDPAALAAAQAGAPVALLGTFLTDLAVAAQGRPLSDQALTSYSASGRQAAGSGVPLRAVVDLYLSAARWAWAALPCVVDASSTSAVREVGTLVLGAVDDAVAAVCEGHQDASRAALRAEEALRRELVDDLLTGSSDAAALAEAASALGLRLDLEHVVVVVSGSRRFVDGRVMVRDLDAALRAPARHRELAPNLLVVTRHGQLVVVLPAPRSSDRGLEAALLVITARLNQERSLTWRAAVSRSRGGVSGVRLGFEEARWALQLSTRLPDSPQVARAADLLGYQVLGHEQEPLRDLIRSVLLPLVQARGGAVPLLHTLRTYLACGAVTTLTAKELHLSVRAVTYRLQRVRTLTGRDITQPDARFDFDAALRGAILLDWPARAL